ncbi:D-glycero-beta-D-manno-heptose-7-phosphate kinase [Elusimicrobiota bacterium]
MNPENLIPILNQLRQKKILVVGDLIIDKFVTGKVNRISPEAPVPVVNITSEKYMPGGAGNVVNNLLSLDAKVCIGGVVGDDILGDKLIEMLESEGAETKGILKDKDRPTSVKTRIIAEHQQVVRTDRESKEEISEDLVLELNSKLSPMIENIDGVVISDYGKGLITKKLVNNILESAISRKIPLIVDPQVGHFFDYKNVSSITPNAKEAGEALKIKIEDENTLTEAGNKLLEELKCDSVLITRGEQGMTLFESGSDIRHIPTVAKEVYDVTGAGDTVASVYILGLAAGLGFYQSAVLANYAAAVVVGKLGTATVSIDELKQEIERSI